MAVGCGVLDVAIGLLLCGQRRRQQQAGETDLKKTSVHYGDQSRVGESMMLHSFVEFNGKCNFPGVGQKRPGLLKRQGLFHGEFVQFVTIGDCTLFRDDCSRISCHRIT